MAAKKTKAPKKLYANLYPNGGLGEVFKTRKKAKDVGGDDSLGIMEYTLVVKETK